MSERRCPLCGADRAAPLFTKQQTDYWACEACTFRFATPDVNPNLTQTLDGYEVEALVRAARHDNARPT